MKVLKKAEQKNVILDKDFYTAKQLFDLLSSREIFFIDENIEVSFNPMRAFEDTECFRVSLNEVNELKVVYNKEYGFYETVATMKNGKILHVTI